MDVAIAIALRSSPSSLASNWARLLKTIDNSGESLTPHAWLTDREFLRQSADHAASAAAWAAAIAATTAVLVAASLRWTRAAIALVLLAGFEMLNFARNSWATSTLALNYPREWLTAVRSAPGDSRVINPGYRAKIVGTMDQGMILGIRNVWGYDPSVLKRYAETL